MLVEMSSQVILLKSFDWYLPIQSIFAKGYQKVD